MTAADWRASDAERERAVAALQHHHLAGRLDVGELEERVGRAYRAVTVGELRALVQDLPPAESAVVGGPGWAAVGARRPRGPGPAPAYAGFLARCGALALDTLVVGLGIGVLSVIGVNGQPIAWAAEALWPLYFVIGWAIGQTPGMLALGLRVVRVEDRRRPGLRRAIARLGGWLVAAAPMGLGFLWAAWDPGRQGWHDKVAGTMVVERTAPVARLPPGD